MFFRIEFHVPYASPDKIFTVFLRSDELTLTLEMWLFKVWLFSDFLGLNLALPIYSCVALGRLLNVSGSSSPLLQGRHDESPVLSQTAAVRSSMSTCEGHEAVSTARENAPGTLLSCQHQHHYLSHVFPDLETVVSEIRVCILCQVPNSYKVSFLDPSVDLGTELGLVALPTTYRGVRHLPREKGFPLVGLCMEGSIRTACAPAPRKQGRPHTGTQGGLSLGGLLRMLCCLALQRFCSPSAFTSFQPQFTTELLEDGDEEAGMQGSLCLK